MNLDTCLKFAVILLKSLIGLNILCIVILIINLNENYEMDSNTLSLYSRYTPAYSIIPFFLAGTILFIWLGLKHQKLGPETKNAAKNWGKTNVYYLLSLFCFILITNFMIR